jgi:REP element-mobilizing transposase RayT
MLRGVNGQQIFEEREDFEKFLQVLKDCKAISEFKVFAYCLMGNHIHILLQETNESVELIMKRIANRFVYWYNIKYKRSGHLFQDRFKSEPVDNDAYLLTVLRYIHQVTQGTVLCVEQRINGYRPKPSPLYEGEGGLRSNSDEV